jgi:hypothetical protein
MSSADNEEYDGKPLRGMPLAELHSAVVQLRNAIDYAQKQMTAAWNTADTSVMAEARQAWQPIIRSRHAELSAVQREINRRS